MPEPITDLTILLTIGLWAVLLPLGVSLFRHSGATMATGIGSDSQPSGDD